MPFLVGIDADRHWLAADSRVSGCILRDDDDGLLSLPVLIDARSLSALVVVGGGDDDENEAADDEPASKGGAAPFIRQKPTARRASINLGDRIIMVAYSE